MNQVNYKFKIKSNILKSSNKFILYKFFYNFFFIYIKMLKNLSAKYYEETKERLQKKSKKTKIRKRKKKRQYGREGYRNLREDESLLTIEKNIIERQKMLYYNLENFALL